MGSWAEVFREVAEVPVSESARKLNSHDTELSTKFDTNWCRNWLHLLDRKLEHLFHKSLQIDSITVQVNSVQKLHNTYFLVLF
jgi:hypothetical protein